jgi:hypothetical protein
MWDLYKAKEMDLLASVTDRGCASVNLTSTRKFCLYDFLRAALNGA